jgi:hypothetical protein
MTLYGTVETTSARMNANKNPTQTSFSAMTTGNRAYGRTNSHPDLPVVEA